MYLQYFNQWEYRYSIEYLSKSIQEISNEYLFEDNENSKGSDDTDISRTSTPEHEEKMKKNNKALLKQLHSNYEHDNVHRLDNFLLILESAITSLFSGIKSLTSKLLACSNSSLLETAMTYANLFLGQIPFGGGVLVQICLMEIQKYLNTRKINHFEQVSKYLSTFSQMDQLNESISIRITYHFSKLILSYTEEQWNLYLIPKLLQELTKHFFQIQLYDGNNLCFLGPLLAKVLCDHFPIHEMPKPARSRSLPSLQVKKSRTQQ